MLRSETGRLVVVTGGSDGIGIEVARMFSSCGDRVVIAHKSPAKGPVASRAAGAVMAVACDLGTVHGIRSLVAALDDKKIDTIDVLVNNVGIRIDPLPEDSDLSLQASRAEELIWTNFMSAFLLISALEGRLRSPGGRIVNITSRAAYVGGEPVYVATKAAAASLQLSLAEKLGASGITINSVSPGFVPETGMFRDRIALERTLYEAERAPVRRVGTVQDIAKAVAFLSSPDSGYITGQTLKVDGGVTRGI